MDVIRTRMQTGECQNGVVRCVIDVMRRSGISGLYTGISGPFLAQALYKSIIFTTNTFVSTSIFRGQKNSLSIFTSGLIAGSVNALVVSPVELIRTRQILAQDRPNSRFSCKGFIASVKVLLSEGGVLGLWRGLLAAVLRDGPGLGAYFLAFEKCKSYFASNLHRNTTRTSSSMLSQSQLPQQLSATVSVSSPVPATGLPLWVRFLAGSCAGVAFWVVALPLDSVKVILEASPRVESSLSGQLSLICKVVSERGVLSLFHAWPVAIGRGVPSAAVTLTTYDLISEWLARKREEKR
jgi:solute carrier family 25 (mitochondrial carnitine/acylcarnitine transporter), member 20/29